MSLHPPTPPPAAPSLTALPPPPRYDLWPIAMQHAMKLRGALIACGPGMRGAAWPDTACVRLVALGPWLGTGLCASHLTAAWVWSAAEHPGPPLSIAALPGRHGVTRVAGGVRRHELRLQPADCASFEELRVTLPLRTALDLLHDPVSFEHRHAGAVAALVAMQPGGAESVRRRLQEHRRPHRRLAEQRLGAILARDRLHPAAPALDSA